MSSLAPDLKRGLTFASFQLRNSPDNMLLLTINVRLGVKTLAANLRFLGLYCLIKLIYLHSSLSNISVQKFH